jgi:hypothetical protein
MKSPENLDRGDETVHLPIYSIYKACSWLRLGCGYVALMDKLCLTTGLGQRFALPTYPRASTTTKKLLLFFQGKKQQRAKLDSLALSRVRSSAPQPVPPFLLTTSQHQPQVNSVSVFSIFAMHSKEGKCRGTTGT